VAAHHARAREGGYTCIAPDLRGFGDSDKPLDGYDARTVAEDIAQVVAGLGFAQVDVAGHDVGGMVAYAFAKAHPQRVRRLAIMEGLPPGFDPPARADRRPSVASPSGTAAST
jgi:pimeloyl-ACP methyl ester carboxylesterase